jgi:hypothetical protein
MAAAQGALGDGVALVSIDVDANESADLLARHATNNNLGWTFAVAPVPMQRALAAEFGRNVLNPPAGNLILITREGTAQYLRPGVKSADELVRTVAPYR